MTSYLMLVPLVGVILLVEVSAGQRHRPVRQVSDRMVAQALREYLLWGRILRLAVGLGVALLVVAMWQRLVGRTDDLTPALPFLVTGGALIGVMRRETRRQCAALGIPDPGEHLRSSRQQPARTATPAGER